MDVTLLGTGTSVGIPIIGCSCEVCTSEDPRDRRMRCACLVVTGGLHIVIDTGPDFRQQMLDAGVRRLDAVLYTHHHFDHVAGIGDLRPYFFGNRNALPCYADADTAQQLTEMFPWAFRHDQRDTLSPNLELRRSDAPFTLHSRYGEQGSVEVTPFRLRHGWGEVTGYRMGRFAYLTDTSHVPEPAYEHLQGLDLLVIDALRPRPHVKHLSIDQAVEVGRRVQAKQTVFIHMTHGVLHAREDALLPEGFMLGYDGRTFHLPENA